MKFKWIKINHEGKALVFTLAMTTTPSVEKNNFKENDGICHKSNGEGKRQREEPTKGELDVVMSVFKSFETGLREGTIFPKVILFFLEND